MKIYKKIRPLLVLEGFEVSNFRDVDIEDLTDVRKIKIDKNLPQEKRQAQYLKQVGNPYLLRRGSMMIKVSFANNGLSMEQAFENLLLNV